MATLNKLRNIRAFTLVELLIVIIIIAVLAAIAIPKFANSGARSKESALKADLKLYRNGVELFRNDTGAYPAVLADLAVTAAPASGLNPDASVHAITATDWKGPYVGTIEKDPVSGNNFTYDVTSPNVGKVTSSAAGNDSAGNAFSGY